MKKKKIIAISIIWVIVVAILIASYVLIVMPKLENKQIAEEIAKVEQEKYETGASTSNWDLERVNIVYDTANIPVPVPKGYVASSIEGEHTVNTGFVIYEGEDVVNDANKDTAQKTRNQWVWVPVEDPSEIYGTDSQGKKYGKLYNFDSNGRTANNWTETNGVMSITESHEHREPDVLGYLDNDVAIYMNTFSTEETRNNLNKELEQNFEKTIESIEKYGGFYIGRYETGGLNSEAKIVKGDEDIANQTWYTMYEKSKELKGKNENVVTSMIWGCQWDATLEWLVKSGSKTYSEVGSNSTSWGNYYDSTFSYINSSGETITKEKDNTSTRIPTGSTEYTKANNIYDMAGNVRDRTLEAGYGYRDSRGGAYENSGVYWPVAQRSYSSSFRLEYCGTRASLYVAV